MSNIEQLRMFVEAAETGSFSASARKLGKAQSAVSQGISNLEIDLGVQLFDRKTRKPSITPEGIRLLMHAKAVIQQSVELNTAANAINRQEETSLTLVIDSALLLPFVLDKLEQFALKFRATAIELITIDSADIIDYIATGKADLGCMFIATELNPQVDFCYIGHLPFTPVCSLRHPLADQDKVTISDLLQHRQILQRGYSGSITEQFPEMSAEIWWSNNFENVSAMVKQSLGWAYVPSHYLIQNMTAGSLHPLPVTFENKEWSPPVDLITKKNQTLGPALSWLHHELKGMLD